MAGIFMPQYRPEEVRLQVITANARVMSVSNVHTPLSRRDTASAAGMARDGWSEQQRS